MQFFHYFRLIRPFNLLITIGTMVLVYRLLIVSNNGLFRDHLDLLALVIINTTIIMAGGNVINDIFDVAADRYNKIDRWYVGNVIPVRAAFVFYLILSIAGLAITCVIHKETANEWLLFIFLLSMILLYIYSRILKKIPLIGNMLIACLCALSLWIVPLTFSLNPNYPLPLNNQVHAILLALSVFAWMTTLMREVIKDVQDIKGDRQMGTQTLAHLFALRTIKKALLFFAVSILIGLLSLLAVWSEKLTFVPMIYLFGLVFSALFLLYQIYRMKERVDWSRMSQYLKLYMVQGLIFLALI